MTSLDEGRAPLLTVIRGRPTPAELAAVTAVLLTSGTAATAPPMPPARPSGWAAGSRLRAPLPRPGPGSWRASAAFR